MTSAEDAAVSVLVVDDEPQLVRALGVNLRARGYVVHAAANGAQALDLAARHKPHVVLLDLGLPDLDGVEVVEGLRGWTSVPIIVLSARQESVDKVRALDAGADDYVTKPFAMDELLARLRAAVRRGAAEPGGDPVVEVGDLVIDLAASRVTRDGSPVHLTPTEWRVLEVLAKNVGRLVSHRQLLQSAWGPQHGSESNYLRLYVGQLRAKLERDPSRPAHLLTEPGWGYRLQP